MKRSIQNTSEFLAKKQKIMKSLGELLQEVANGQFDDFRQYLQEKEIIYLDLSFKIKNSPICKNFDNLGKALQGTNVTKVHVGSNNLRAEDVISFVKALKGTPVASVNLSYNPIGSKVAIEVINLLKESKVNKIYLYGCYLYDNSLAGITEFAKSLEGTKFTEIDLKNNCIDERGAVVISEHIPHTCLIQVHLGFENKTLSEALRLNELALKLNEVNLNPKLPITPYYSADQEKNIIQSEGQEIQENKKCKPSKI